MKKIKILRTASVMVKEFGVLKSRLSRLRPCFQALGCGSYGFMRLIYLYNYQLLNRCLPRHDFSVQHNCLLLDYSCYSKDELPWWQGVLPSILDRMIAPHGVSFNSSARRNLDELKEVTSPVPKDSSFICSAKLIIEIDNVTTISSPKERTVINLFNIRSHGRYWDEEVSFNVRLSVF